MKTHSRILRGYNNNNHANRSAERHTAPSAMKPPKKNRVAVFSDPKAYVLPRVPRSHV